MQVGATTIYILTRTASGYVLTSTIDNYEALTFSRSFFNIGTFEFSMMADSMQAQFVQVDSLIIVGDAFGGTQARVGIIQSVDRSVGNDSKKLLTATGHEAKLLMAWRNVDPGTVARLEISAAFETAVKALVNSQCGTTATDANRVFPGFSTALDQGRGATYQFSERWSNLSDAIQKASISAEIGWKVFWDGSGLVFDMIIGTDRTLGNGTNNPAVLSTDFDTVKESHFLLSRENYRNYSYTGGQGVGPLRTIRPVYTGASVPTGFDRREIFTDARDLFDTTKLDTRGAQALAEQSYQSYSEAVINPYATFSQSSGVDLGDLVTIDSFGYSQTSRVTEIIEQWGIDGYDCQFSLDRTLPTVQSNAKGEAYKQSRLTTATEIGSPEDFKDPTGFSNCNNITVTYDTTTRKVTLSGSFVGYWRGVPVPALATGASWVSDAVPTGRTLGQWLYYNGTAFVWGDQATWAFSDLQIAYCYFRADASFLFCQRECHGLMPWTAHAEFHNTIGTWRKSGGILTAGSYVLNSTTAAARRPLIDAAVVSDEDLDTALSAWNVETYTQAYNSGTAITSVSAAAEFVPVSGANPYYNSFATPNWGQTLMGNNSYMSVWLIAVPTAADTGSQLLRYIWIQGQTNGTLAQEQSLTPQSLNTLLLTTILPEYVFISKVIIRYTGGNWQIVQVDNLTGNRFVQVGSPAGLYLSDVTTNASLTGNGTISSPLAAAQVLLGYGLAGYWPFDDGTAADQSGNGNNGTIYGATPVPGISGKALSFNGVNNYIHSLLAIPLTALPLSISFWCYPTATPDGLFDTAPAVAGSFRINSGNIQWGSSDPDVPINATLNAWNHYVIVFEFTTVRTVTLYKNGAFVSMTNGSNSNVFSFTHFNLGCLNENTHFYSGIIDEPRIYSRVLTAAEVYELWRKP